MTQQYHKNKHSPKKKNNKKHNTNDNRQRRAIFMKHDKKNEEHGCYGMFRKTKEWH
jgi:AMMECR1 domain-containing protein